ncbi:MAG: Maf-like protein [Ignavibacteriaceae bacterium]
MIRNKRKIYLASRSPRRQQLLRQLNLNFETISVDADETPRRNESPPSVVKRLSLEKMELAKLKVTDGIIITADTIVVLNGTILGKPVNVKDAYRILKLLSGNKHFVYTGFAVFNPYKNKTIVDYEKTAVTFRQLNMKEIRDYVKSGSPMDKAGAYGVQDDFGAVFVNRIDGCYYNVVGLPLSKFYLALKEMM